MCRKSFWPSRTTNDRQFAKCKITHTSQTLNQPNFFREWHVPVKSSSLRKKLALSGFERDGKLASPMMATTRTSVNKQTQTKNAEQQQTVRPFAKN